MRYKIVKETKPTLASYGKYRAKAVHNGIVENSKIEEEVASRLGISLGAVTGVRNTLWEVINEHLRNGEKVRLKDWGLMKLEIESAKVDTVKEFMPRKHIRGVRLHFLPESSGGSPELYQDIKFVRVRK